jgi:hypothetical protein
LERYALFIVIACVVALQEAGVASRERYSVAIGEGDVFDEGAVVGFAEHHALLSVLLGYASLNPAKPAVMEGYALLVGLETAS